MMNPEIKTKWIVALRSGEYKQGKGLLRRADSNTFCCLGVLCDIVDPKGWSRINDYHTYYHDGHASMPSNSICKMIGLDSDDCGRLIDLNDFHTFSFSQIADYIEEKL